MNKSQSKLADGVSLALAGLLLGAAGFLIVQAMLRPSCNHWGLEIRWLWPACAAAAGWSAIVMALRRRPGGPTLALLAVAAACAATVFVLDYFNVLVEYEAWIARGMPPPWTR